MAEIELRPIASHRRPEDRVGTRSSRNWRRVAGALMLALPTGFISIVMADVLGWANVIWLWMIVLFGTAMVLFGLRLVLDE